MTTLQEFKALFVVGEKVYTKWPNGMEGEREVMYVRGGSVGIENLRPDGESPSRLDWPKASQVRKDDQGRFIVEFWPGNEAWYWKGDCNGL